MRITFELLREMSEISDANDIQFMVVVIPTKEMVFADLEDPDSEARELLRLHHTIRRKPQLGTMPQVYYIV